MRRIVSSKEMALIDLKAQKDFKIPGIILMENAGSGGWKYIADLVNLNLTGGNLVFVAGGGNNGGDALVMARHAFQYFPNRVKVVFASSTMNENCSLHAQIIGKLGIETFKWPEQEDSIAAILAAADLVVDGISGTGLKGALRSSSADLVTLLNGTDSLKVAIDIPSGLGDNFEPGFPFFKADVTLTMGLEKFSLYTPAGRMACGKIKVINPGFPRFLLVGDAEGDGESFNYTFDDFSLPKIPVNSYKNKRGHVGVFAGSTGYLGAAILSSLAAGRVRTGLVTLHVDKELYNSAASSLKSVMVRALEFPFKENFTGNFASFLAGPGWGMNREDVLLKLLDSGIRGVIDADGIRILSGIYRNSGRKLPYDRIVITPHIGEFSFFTGLSRGEIETNTFPILKEVSQDYGVVILLKSHVNYIVSPNGKMAVVDGMNPSLGVGGSGDVLAGIVAGFMAQGMGAFESALMGSLVHQKAGEICFKERGWFLAEDLLPFLSKIVGQAENEKPVNQRASGGR